IIFSGFIHPGQERVAIRVSLQDETGYQTEDLWSFKIPRRPAHVTGRVSFPADLPRAFDRYVESVVESRAAVTLAVIDGDELGRDAFVEEWLRRTHGKQVDLDAALHDTGAWRRYSARSLDLELI